MGNPSKEMYNWKGKCEADKKEKSNLQQKVLTLREKARHVESLKEEEKLHGSHSPLTARIDELEYFLEMEKKSQNDAIITIAEKKSRTDEVMKALQQKKESRVNECEACKGRVGGLKKGVDEAFNQTLKRIYGAFNEAFDHLETLHPDILVLFSQLDPHKVIRDGTMVEDDMLRLKTERFDFILCLMQVIYYILMFSCCMYEI